MSAATLDKPKTKPKGTRVTTEYARQLFLYGEGDGVRVIDVKELIKRSGVCENTIRNRMPEWQKELEDSLRSSSKLGLATTLSVPDEVMTFHHADNEFIRTRLDKTKSELTALPSIIADLRSIISEFVSDPDKYDEALTVFNQYIRLSMNEKSLTKLFIDLKKLWDEKVGLDSLKAIQEATGKAQALASAKTEPSPNPGEAVQVAGGVFRRRD